MTDSPLLRVCPALRRWMRRPFTGGPARGQATGETTLLAGSVTIAVVSLYIIVNPGGTANPIRDKICQQISATAPQSSDTRVLSNAAGMLMGNVCPSATTTTPQSPSPQKRRSG